MTFLDSNLKTNLTMIQNSLLFLSLLILAGCTAPVQTQSSQQPPVSEEQAASFSPAPAADLPAPSSDDSGESFALNTQKGTFPLTLEIADDDEERRSGLMGRTELAPDAGMLFVFQDEQPRRFWMKDTLIPLDIIYLDSTLTVVALVEGMQPCTADPCSTYPSVKPARYALELREGAIESYGVMVGDTIRR